VLTHGNLISNYLAGIKCIGSRPGDRHLLDLPLDRVWGLCLVMNAVFASAGTIVLQRRQPREAMLATLRERQVTHYHGQPSAYLEMLQDGVEPRELASVRTFLSWGAGLPAQAAESWRTRFGSPVLEGYGTTETAPLAAYNHPTAPRAGALGVPVEGVQMRVLDADGRPLGPGQTGEICIKGPNVMAGYLGRPDESRAAVREGWFHTRDLGYRDEEGCYFLV